MDASEQVPAALLQQEVVDLRQESFRFVVAFCGCLSYLWFEGVLWHISPAWPAPTVWVGLSLLTAGTMAGLALGRRYLHAASRLLVAATLGAAVCAACTYPFPASAYLLALPVAFASILLDERAILASAVVACVAALALGLARMRLATAEAALPAAVLGLLAAGSWLSARSQYVALDRLWNAYQSARRNERSALEQRAELRRVLKALEEATYRLERANYSLALARDHAEEAHRLKQQFAQTISHELRTPLNVIVSFAEMITQAPERYRAKLPPAYMRDLGIIYRNACHLQNLINDVLDLARIEAAQMSLLCEEIDPEVLAEEAVDTARRLVTARGLALRTEIEARLPKLWGDPIRIRQVLFNLLNNAARFTKQGSVTVRVRRQGDKIIFAIADTGVGISPENMAHVFEEFRQADGSLARQHGGAGLGLAISRRFVEMHRGRIWVESQVGKGSTFQFSLPIGRVDLFTAPAARAPGASTPVPAGIGEQPILLSVTPSASAAALLARHVHDCRTVAVSTLVQAERMARQLVPQVVVIDHNSGRVTPTELRRLAQLWGVPGTPFVACPLPGEEPLRQRLAVDAYIIKPVSRSDLWDVLRRYSESMEKVLIVDDDRDFVMLLNRMLDDPLRRYQVINAFSGQEALEMIRQHRPDLVLLDLVLPDMHGAQVVDKIRSSPASKHIPVIIVSGQEEIDREECLPGAVLITKAAGLEPGEIVRWIQGVVDTATRVLSRSPV